MKAFRTGHYFLALFFTGFLTGILIVNYIWGEQLSLIGTFTEVYLMRLKNEKISFQQYIWYSGTGNFFPGAVFGDGNPD